MKPIDEERNGRERIDDRADGRPYADLYDREYASWTPEQQQEEDFLLQQLLEAMGEEDE